MTKARIVLALLMVFGAAGLCPADDADDAKELLIGKWHYASAKEVKGMREMTVEFTKDGDYIFTPADKSFKVRKGPYKVTAKDTIEIEITSGLVKGEKKTKKTVKFTVTKDKLDFEPTLTYKAPVKGAEGLVRYEK